MNKIYTKYILFIIVLISLFHINAYTQQWEHEVPSDGSKPTARHENDYVLVGDKFYLLGSRGIRPLDIYDPVTRKWTSGAKPPIELHHFQSVGYNGNIYIIGAFTGGYPTETPVADIYIYNTAENKWSTAPQQIPAGRRRGSAGAVLYNNKIYVVAGITNGHTSGHVKWFDEYNPATGEWKILPDAPHARDHFHAAVWEDKLYVISGRQSSYPNTFGITVNDVDVYDFKTGKWTTLEIKLPTPRAGASVVAANNQVYVIGGESMAHMEAHSETEILDIPTSTFKTGPSLVQGRHGTSAILYNNAIYIAAGNTKRGSGTELSNQEVLRLVSPPLSLSVNPSFLQFGQVKNKTMKSQTITFTNNGSNPVSISSIGLNNDSELSYMLVNNNTLPVSIPAGQSIEVAIQFTPQTEGIKSASLDIQSTAGPKTVAVTGEGTLFVTGINHSAGTDLFSVYPNPFHDHVQIVTDKSLGKVVYEVYNAIGVKHFSGTTDNDGISFNDEAKLLNLPNGIYYLKVNPSDKAQTSYWYKIVKR